MEPAADCLVPFLHTGWLWLHRFPAIAGAPLWREADGTLIADDTSIHVARARLRNASSATSVATCGIAARACRHRARRSRMPRGLDRVAERCGEVAVRPQSRYAPFDHRRRRPHLPAGLSKSATAFPAILSFGDLCCGSIAGVTRAFTASPNSSGLSGIID